ncbi:unnamed protein product [Mycena citricolor]|uniref:Uncharacterized protein n=1 Tax=Mycena citricolor TaxID=2018698 RepID=A0AAD2HH63_9AGAR|nr:unnamed protein product [Mycena citricolor]
MSDQRLQVRNRKLGRYQQQITEHSRSALQSRVQRERIEVLHQGQGYRIRLGPKAARQGECQLRALSIMNLAGLTAADHGIMFAEPRPRLRQSLLTAADLALIFADKREIHVLPTLQRQEPTQLIHATELVRRRLVDSDCLQVDGDQCVPENRMLGTHRRFEAGKEVELALRMGDAGSRPDPVLERPAERGCRPDLRGHIECTNHQTIVLRNSQENQTVSKNGVAGTAQQRKSANCVRWCALHLNTPVGQRRQDVDSGARDFSLGEMSWSIHFECGPRTM